MPIEVQTYSTQNVLFVIPDPSWIFVVIVILRFNGSEYKCNNYDTKYF